MKSAGVRTQTDLGEAEEEADATHEAQHLAGVLLHDL